MLYIPADRGIDVPSCAFIIPEGCGVIQSIRIIKVCFRSHQCTAIPDIFINVVDSQQSAVFTKGDIRGMNHVSPVVQFISFSEPEAQGICSGKDNLHTLHCVNVREYGCTVNKVFKQSDFVKQNILVPKRTESFQVCTETGHIVCCSGFDIYGFGSFFSREIVEKLKEKCGLARSSESV